MSNINNIGTGQGATKSTGLGVSNQSPWYLEMHPKWEKIDALLGGTIVMREKSETYLPKFPLENDDFYAWRRNTAVLTNFFKHMAEHMVGKIFAKQMEIKTNIPKEILNDIDRQGTSIHAFARQLAFDIISKGMSHVFVDYPKVSGPITTKEQKERNIRPFWVRVSPNSLIAASTSKINDSDNLSQVRWYEYGTDILGYEERNYERIRVIKEKIQLDDDGNYIAGEDNKPIVIGFEWELWEDTHARFFTPKIDSNTKTSGGFAMVESGDLSIDRIPLVSAYADKTGFYTSNLPLEDVALLNILHWQQSSDLNNIIRLSQAPLLFCKGLPDRPEAKGGSVVFYVSGEGEEIEHADMKYVEPGGDSIAAGERALERIIKDAQMIGMRMFERSRSVETATGEQLEKNEDASPLQLIAMELESQIKRALDFTCDWLDLEKDNEVKVNKDFAFTGDESKAADHMSLLFANGVVTKKTYLEHMKEYGILKQSVDVDREILDSEKEFDERQRKNSPNTEQNPLIKSKEGLAGGANQRKIKE